MEQQWCQWYQFRAYNTQTQYGYGTEMDAEQYCDILNRNREVNVYGLSVLTDDDGAEIAKRSDTLILSDEIAARIDGLVDAVLHAPDLDNLLTALVEFRAHYGAYTAVAEQEYDIDMSSLPTFGGTEPASTTGVWSWDETRLLVGEGDYEVISREEWAEHRMSGQ